MSDLEETSWFVYRYIQLSVGSNFIGSSTCIGVIRTCGRSSCKSFGKLDFSSEDGADGNG